jgi:anti-sigma B factor antagonist
MTWGGGQDRERLPTDPRNSNQLQRSTVVASWRYSSADMNLDLETSTQGDTSVVSLRGEIDVYTAPRLRQALIDLVSQGATDIVVDMDKVDFLDSTGLGVLVGGLKRVKSNDGDLRLVVTQDRIMKIFDITGLSKVFPIHGSLDEALHRA